MCREGGHLLRRVPNLAREDFMLYRSILNQRFCLYIVHGEALFDARPYVERVFSNNQTGGTFIGFLCSIVYISTGQDELLDYSDGDLCVVAAESDLC